MKIDFYTKAVLTVIAACLVILIIRQTTVMPEAKAQGFSSAKPDYALVPVNPDGTIKFPSTIDVRIIGVRTKRSESDPLPVSIEDCNTSIRVDK